MYTRTIHTLAFLQLTLTFPVGVNLILLPEQGSQALQAGRGGRAAGGLDVVLGEVALIPGLVPALGPAVSVVPLDHEELLIRLQVELVCAACLCACVHREL